MDQITDLHLKFLANKNTRHKNVIKNIRVKNLTTAKSLANKIYNLKESSE